MTSRGRRYVSAMDRGNVFTSGADQENSSFQSAFTFESRPSSSTRTLSSGNSMRRSRSSGERFVNGTRNRNVRSTQSRDEMFARTPQTQNRYGATANVGSRGDEYWKNEYRLNDYKTQHREDFNEKEFNTFHRWIFQREKDSSVERDIDALMKMLFGKK